MKKSKKFVLAALALLAITGLLALAGCKNDSVPETPAAKLVSIAVTPPTRTVYSVGQSFDPTGMVVTATYNDGESKDVTDLATTNFNTVAGEKGLDKTVTVSYKERETAKTTTFTVTVFPKEVKVLTGYTSPNNTDDSWTYVAFGEWPQTIKDADVTVYETESKKMGMFTYYLGDDDNYYVKITAKPYVDTYTYTYSDGSPVEKDEEVYFKVEPIVWRVLTTSYEAPEDGTVGEILLLAEKILTGGIKWADSDNNYKVSYIRQWLNGNSETGETSDYKGDAGFLQTAFTQSALDKIAHTTVDNSAASTFGTGERTTNNPYVCGKTKDKIFLLSQQEATNSEYGFGAYNESGKGSTRIRITTDYAEATGAYQQGNPSEGYGGWWWLRSPSHLRSMISARVIGSNGYTVDLNFSDDNVYRTDGGVVPALSISLGGN